MWQLPARLAATLAAGLRPDSRIKQKESGLPVSSHDLLLAALLDQMRLLVWQNTKDGHKGRNAPESVMAALMGKTKKTTVEMGHGFRTVDEFRSWREKMMEGTANGC